MVTILQSSWITNFKAYLYQIYSNTAVTKTDQTKTATDISQYKNKLNGI